MLHKKYLKSIIEINEGNINYKIMTSFHNKIPSTDMLSLIWKKIRQHVSNYMKIFKTDISQTLWFVQKGVHLRGSTVQELLILCFSVKWNLYSSLKKINSFALRTLLSKLHNMAFQMLTSVRRNMDYILLLKTPMLEEGDQMQESSLIVCG